LTEGGGAQFDHGVCGGWQSAGDRERSAIRSTATCCKLVHRVARLRRSTRRRSCNAIQRLAGNPFLPSPRQRNATYTKQFQNCYETVMKRFCFDLISLGGQFNMLYSNNSAYMLKTLINS